jgi:anti-anti-sigma factor
MQPAIACPVLQDAPDHDGESVSLDLDECTFVDSLGVGVIAEAATRPAGSGRRLVVCNVHGQVRRCSPFSVRAPARP